MAPSLEQWRLDADKRAAAREKASARLALQKQTPPLDMSAIMSAVDQRIARAIATRAAITTESTGRALGEVRAEIRAGLLKELLAAKAEAAVELREQVAKLRNEVGALSVRLGQLEGGHGQRLASQTVDIGELRAAVQRLGDALAPLVERFRE